MYCFTSCNVPNVKLKMVCVYLNCLADASILFHNLIIILLKVVLFISLVGFHGLPCPLRLTKFSKI